MTDGNYKPRLRYPKLKKYNLLDLGMGIRVQAINHGRIVWLHRGNDFAEMLPINQTEIENMVFKGHYEILLSKNRLSKKDRKIIKISQMLASTSEFNKICEKLIKEIDWKSICF